MPIRGMSELLKKLNILTSFTANSLENRSLGLDMMWFLRKYILSQVNTSNNSQSMTDLLFYGISDESKEKIKHFIDFVIEKNIQLTCVWPGIEPLKSSKPKFKASLDHSKDLDIFEKNSRWTVPFEHLIQEINTIFTEYIQSSKNGECNEIAEHFSIVRAPYTAQSQLAYFKAINLVDHVFSSSDFLLFGDEVITEFSFIEQNKSAAALTKTESLEKLENLINVAKIDSPGTRNMTVICRDTIREKLSISPEEMRIFFISVGCEFISTIPFFHGDFSTITVFDVLKKANFSLEILEQQILLEYNEHMVVQHIQLMKNALIYTSLHPVMSLEGKVEVFTYQETIEQPTEESSGCSSYNLRDSKNEDFAFERAPGGGESSDHEKHVDRPKDIQKQQNDTQKNPNDASKNYAKTNGINNYKSREISSDQKSFSSTKSSFDSQKQSSETNPPYDKQYKPRNDLNRNKPYDSYRSQPKYNSFRKEKNNKFDDTKKKNFYKSEYLKSNENGDKFSNHNNDRNFYHDGKNFSNEKFKSYSGEKNTSDRFYDKNASLPKRNFSKSFYKPRDKSWEYDQQYKSNERVKKYDGEYKKYPSRDVNREIWYSSKDYHQRNVENKNVQEIKVDGAKKEEQMPKIARDTADKIKNSNSKIFENVKIGSEKKLENVKKQNLVQERSNSILSPYKPSNLEEKHSPSQDSQTSTLSENAGWYPSNYKRTSKSIKTNEKHDKSGKLADNGPKYKQTPISSDNFKSITINTVPSSCIPSDFEKIFKNIKSDRWYQELFSLSIRPSEKDKDFEPILPENEVKESTQSTESVRLESYKYNLKNSTVISKNKQKLLIALARASFFKHNGLVKLLMLFENNRYVSIKLHSDESKYSNSVDWHSDERFVDENECFKFYKQNDGQLIRFFLQVLKINNKMSFYDQNESEINLDHNSCYYNRLPLQNLVYIYKTLPDSNPRIKDYLKESLEVIAREGIDLTNTRSKMIEMKIFKQGEI